MDCQQAASDADPFAAPVGNALPETTTEGIADDNGICKTGLPETDALIEETIKSCEGAADDDAVPQSDLPEPDDAWIDAYT